MYYKLRKEVVIITNFSKLLWVIAILILASMYVTNRLNQENVTQLEEVTSSSSSSSSSIEKEIVKEPEDLFIELTESSVGSYKVTTFVDRETGVEYIITGARGSYQVTPRLDSEGKVYIKNKEEDNR